MWHRGEGDEPNLILQIKSSANRLKKNEKINTKIAMAERFHFHKRDPRDGKTLNKCIAELKMSSKCESGQFLKEALRDKLVCGLRIKVIQEMMTVDKLTFTKTVTYMLHTVVLLHLLPFEVSPIKK
jgi:hypothetical protein